MWNENRRTFARIFAREAASTILFFLFRISNRSRHLDIFSGVENDNVRRADNKHNCDDLSLDMLWF